MIGNDYVVIVGSRCVTDRPDAIAWAKGLIASALAARPEARVLTGDAKGVDALAIRSGRHWTALSRYGGITHGAPVPEDWTGVAHGDFGGWWLDPPNGPPNIEGHAAWRDRLLARDRALAAYARGCVERGGKVQALALVADWSKTHGTEYTACHLVDAGISTRVEVFHGGKVAGR